MSEIRIPVPGSDVEIAAVMGDDGQPVFIPKHICDSFGIPWSAQHERLTSPAAEHWSTIRKIRMVAADGKLREMLGVDQLTLIAWLTTMPPTLITDPARRQELIGFQRRSFNALVDFYTKGGAINPRATAGQLMTLAEQASLLATLQPYLPPKLAEMKAATILARGMGEAPEVAWADIPIQVEEYLTDRGISSSVASARAVSFGKDAAALYRDVRGEDPPKVKRELKTGWWPVNVYTNGDRADVLDVVFGEWIAAGRFNREYR